MIKGVEEMMDVKKSGLSLTPVEMREVFGSFDPAEHAEEAERRWGGTEAYAESQRRAASYDNQHWLQIRDEAERISAGLAAAMRDGAPPDSERAMDLAEQHRQHITRWFYNCSYDTHRGLGEMYVADPRFTANYDEQEPGLAAYIRDAITANAERALR